jgi:hypothetical protein
MVMDDITVGTWNELSDRLYVLSWNARLNRLRSPYVYRGMADARSGLATSLMRLGGPYWELEAPILASFRKYAQAGAQPADSLWNWLALAQHHGLPTRLLDWTYSPYVALHFLTEPLGAHDADGALWCANRRAVHEALPERLRARLEAEHTDVFTAEMLQGEAPTLRDFAALAEREFAAFFEPPSLDERIVNQFALFSLQSSPRGRMDEWLRGRPGAAVRLVIPARLKWEIRDRLDEANVTERVLYPGLDGLSRWLRRYYMPRKTR